MSVDLSKIKPGDSVTLTVTGEVREQQSGNLVVLLAGGQYDTTFEARELAAAEIKFAPKALAVGDRVRKLALDPDQDGSQRTYTITAIDADGWVLLADRGASSRVTSSLRFVERVDA